MTTNREAIIDAINQGILMDIRTSEIADTIVRITETPPTTDQPSEFHAYALNGHSMCDKCFLAKEHIHNSECCNRIDDHRFSIPHSCNGL